MKEDGWQRMHEGERFVEKGRGVMIYTRINECESRGGTIQRVRYR